VHEKCKIFPYGQYISGNAARTPTVSEPSVSVATSVVCQSVVCLSHVKSLELCEIRAKFRHLYRKSGSHSKNMTSDFALQVDSPNVASNPQIVQNSVRAYCLALLRDAVVCIRNWQKFEAIQRWSAICRVWPWTLTYQKFLLCISSQGQDLYSHRKLYMYIYWFSSESGYRRRGRQRRTPQYKGDISPITKLRRKPKTNLVTAAQTRLSR